MFNAVQYKMLKFIKNNSPTTNLLLEYYESPEFDVKDMITKEMSTLIKCSEVPVTSSPILTLTPEGMAYVENRKKENILRITPMIISIIAIIIAIPAFIVAIISICG